MYCVSFDSALGSEAWWERDEGHEGGHEGVLRCFADEFGDSPSSAVLAFAWPAVGLQLVDRLTSASLFYQGKGGEKGGMKGQKGFEKGFDKAVCFAQIQHGNPTAFGMAVFVWIIACDAL